MKLSSTTIGTRSMKETGIDFSYRVWKQRVQKDEAQQRWMDIRKTFNNKWMHPDALEQMYDQNYAEWCQAGVARILPEFVAYDRKGKVLESSDDPCLQFGLRSFWEVTHPEYILYAEECILDLSTCHEDTTTARSPATKHTKEDKLPKRVTMCPLISCSGDTVACIVVYASQRRQGIPIGWVTGIDSMVEPVLKADGEIDLANDLNHGPGKWFPYGPTCKFRGHEIPTFVSTSPSGSVTSDIFKKVLQFLDEKGIYERGPGLPEPCLILDGFDTRLHFKDDFRNYIQENPWHVTLGPFRQKGVVASEQTLTFQQAFRKAKHQLYEFQELAGWQRKLDTMDLIPLINSAWSMTFGLHLEDNRNAIANRGFYPPTEKLLREAMLYQQEKALRCHGNTRVIVARNHDNDDETPESSSTSRILDRLFAEAAANGAAGGGGGATKRRRLDASNDDDNEKKSLKNPLVFECPLVGGMFM